MGLWVARGRPPSGSLFRLGLGPRLAVGLEPGAREARRVDGVAAKAVAVPREEVAKDLGGARALGPPEGKQQLRREGGEGTRRGRWRTGAVRGQRRAAPPTVGPGHREKLWPRHEALWHEEWRTWCSALEKRQRMTHRESSKDATQPSDGSSSRMRARTNRFMFSAEAGRRTSPVGTARGCGLHALMRDLVCALPKVAKVRAGAVGPKAAVCAIMSTQNMAAGREARILMDQQAAG